MPSVDPVEYDDIQQRVVKRYNRRLQFLVHVAAYLGGNLFFWGIWFGVQVGIIPSKNLASDHILWPLITMFGWGIVLLFHGISILLAPQIERDRERALQREIALEKARSGLTTDAYEKPKRHQAVRLSDDGELVPVDEGDENDTRLVTNAKRGGT